MKLLGSPSDFLSLCIERDRPNRKMRIHQIPYLLKVLKKFNLNSHETKVAPLPEKLQLIKNTAQADKASIRLFQSQIGSILYAMLGTRPDIAYATIRLSQYASNPSDQHFKAINHLLRYINGTVNYCLEYDGKSKRSYLHGYSDSSYAEDLDTRRSVSGHMFLLGGAAISWSSKLQRTVSLSSTEAEYVEVSEAARQALWFRNLIKELGDPIKEPITLFGDNHASIFLTEEPKHDRRIKHVDVKWHFVREHIERRDVVLYYVPSSNQVADDLTKPLGSVAHYKCVKLMGIKQIKSIESHDV
jgi:hypothetical protein